MDIDSIALKTIYGIVGSIYNYIRDNKEDDYMRVATLGEISGVMRLAEELKTYDKGGNDR